MIAPKTTTIPIIANMFDPVAAGSSPRAYLSVSSRSGRFLNLHLKGGRSIGQAAGSRAPRRSRCDPGSVDVLERNAVEHGVTTAAEEWFMNKAGYTGCLRMPRPLARAAKRAIQAVDPAADRVRALVQDPSAQAAVRWFASERRWIDDLQLQICRIPAPTFFEQRRAEWVAATLASIGWEARIDRAGNVIA